jgi:LPXTG-motif cell wall-anchored protein
MYAGKGAAVLPVAAAVVTLPNTGANLLVSSALAIAAGMLTWGVVYARTR